MPVQMEKGLSRAFYARPWFIVRFGIWVCTCIVFVNSLTYCALHLLRLDPFLAPMLDKYNIQHAYLVVTAFGLFLFSLFLIQYRKIVVTLDENNGIELRIGHRRKHVAWSEVAAFKYRFSKHIPHALYVLGKDDGSFVVTPILVIPTFVECRLIARFLEEMGIPKERRRCFVKIWNCHQ